jgi:hypothetical protein
MLTPDQATVHQHKAPIGDRAADEATEIIGKPRLPSDAELASALAVIAHARNRRTGDYTFGAYREDIAQQATMDAYSRVAEGKATWSLAYVWSRARTLAYRQHRRDRLDHAYREQQDPEPSIGPSQEHYYELRELVRRSPEDVATALRLTPEGPGSAPSVRRVRARARLRARRG